MSLTDYLKGFLQAEVPGTFLAGLNVLLPVVLTVITRSWIGVISPDSTPAELSGLAAKQT